MGPNNGVVGQEGEKITINSVVLGFRRQSPHHLPVVMRKRGAGAELLLQVVFEKARKRWIWRRRPARQL